MSMVRLALYWIQVFETHGLSMPRRFHSQALLSGERLLQQPGGATGKGPALRAALVPEGAELPAAVLRAWTSRFLRSTADWPNGKGPNTRGLRLAGHASNFARGLDLFGHQVVDARSRGLDLIEHEALFVASLIVQAILVAGDVTFCQLVVWNMTFSPRTIGCFSQLEVGHLKTNIHHRSFVLQAMLCHVANVWLGEVLRPLRQPRKRKQAYRPAARHA